MLALLGTIALVLAAFAIIVLLGAALFVCDHAAADQAVRTNRRARPRRTPPGADAAYVNYWT